MMLAGMETVEYDAAAQIKSASAGAEIVLVLDNTNSMNADGKLDALKSAATSFTNAIMTDNTGGSIDIGIVPFSNHVNVGLGNRNASWIDVPDDSTSTDPNYCSMKRDVIATSNCRNETRYSDGVAYERYICDRTYGEPYQVCEPRTTSETWHGCVGSREEPYNLEDRGYGARRVPGLMNVSCGAPITPLTNVKSEIIDQIDDMVGSNDTYIPAGLTWGMRVLSDGAPFSEGVSKAKAQNKNIKKYLILMTDGDNTRSAQLPGSPSHWGNDAAQANEWTTKVCDNIKADGITSVYTITFGTLLEETKDLIKGCASSETQYFHATTGDDLAATFDEIRNSIMALHLSM